MIVPGTYTVVLDYGGEKSRQTFTIALDPRLHATAEDLGARLALTQQIQADVNALNGEVNAAIAAREKLEKAVSAHSLTEAQAGGALDVLNSLIGSDVQMKIRSSEGDTMQEVKLHAFLAYLAADVEVAYARPTAAEYAVFRELDKQTKAAEQKLEAAVAVADKAVK